MTPIDCLITGGELGRKTPRRELILAMAQRRQGVSSAEVQATHGLSEHDISCDFHKMVRRGVLVRVKVVGEKIRWFASAADAEHYATDPGLIEARANAKIAIAVSAKARRLANRQARAAARKAAKPPKPAKAPKLAAFNAPIKTTGKPAIRTGLLKRTAVPAPVTIRERREIPADVLATMPKTVIPAIGVCAGHDPRYSCGPNDDVPSIFRSLPLGATLSGAQA